MKIRDNMFKKGFFVHKLCLIIGFFFIIASILGYLSYTGRLVLFGGDITNATTTTTTTEPEIETLSPETTTTEETTTVETTTTRRTTTSTTTTIPSADHVVFSEVFYDTPGDDDIEEWIELYNPTSDTVDLSGLTIEDNGTNFYTIPDGTMISPDEFLVIARDETGFHDLYEDSPDLSDLTLKLNNNGDFLKLMDDSEEIDMVAWENYVDGWDLVADRGESIQRDPPHKDNDNDDDWIINTDPDPEPGGLVTSTTTAITTIVTTIPTDTTPPTITIISPENTTYSTTSIELKVSANEAIGTWMYSLNNGVNMTFTPNTTITAQEELNNIIVFVDDTSGNMGVSDKVYFTIHTGPYINQIEPVEEWVEIISSTETNMTDWTLHDNNSVHVYPFPSDFILLGSVKVHTEEGIDTQTDLYWNTTYVWNDAGDVATLKDDEGTVIDQKSY